MFEMAFSFLTLETTEGGDELIHDTADDPAIFDVVESIEDDGASDFHAPTRLGRPYLSPGGYQQDCRRTRGS